MPNDVQGAVCPKIEGGVCDVERRLAGATDPDASEGIDGDRVGAIGMAARVVDARSQASVCYSLKLELQQADGEVVAHRAAPPGWIRSANACQTRSFVKSAAACSSDSTMPITGTATLTDASDDGSGEPIAVISVQGSMFAGLNLDSATLEIWFEEGTASVHWHEAEGFSVNSFHATAVGTGRLDIDYRGNG